MSAAHFCRPRLVPLLSVTALVFLFFFHLGARDLVSSHEARAAQNAQRMLVTGAWGLPTLFDGQADYQKPPGFYWFAAVIGWLNGGTVTPWVARLPAALSAVGTVLVVYAFLRSAGYTTAALVAATVLATSNHFVAIGRTARIDVPLTCAVTVSLLSYYRAIVARAPDQVNVPRATGWVFLSALAAGWAVLLKGPVALALIGPVAAAFAVLEQFSEHRPRLGVRSAVLGVLVTAGVAAPWFIWVNSATDGEFSRVFFWHHNIERFTGESEALASHPWWYYGPRLALALLPWALPLPLLLVWGFYSGAWRQDRVFRFGVVWLVLMVVVLSAARFKRADYLLPAFPGAALALGCAAERWRATRPAFRRSASWGFALLLAGALAVWPIMWLVVEPAEAAKQEKRPFATAIRTAAPVPAPVLLFRTESHLLAYHLGPPLNTLVEWGELKAALAVPGPHVIVMPPEMVAEAARLTQRTLAPVADLVDFTSVHPHRPLVCVRTAD
jgi:4-amino-4-deoxy-L-arabinose transferase-like glycosyltransferase